MKRRTKLLYTLSAAFILSCKNDPKATENTTVTPTPETEKTAVITKPDFVWSAANTYFLLTDRFNNGNPDNDITLNRTKETGLLRGFEGGDIQGIINKIEDGYFSDLGINAIWFSPVQEQIHDSVDEGTGSTYGFHGYWTKDWTNIDPNFGTHEDLKKLVTTAHKHGIRILMDVVLNHTGPVTDTDKVWPESWVRTTPQCTYKDYETAVTCTLVKNLPDVKSESNETVELPQFLIDKWKKEGRLKQELAELDTFFETSGLVRAPKNYIIKWLTDYVRELGIDGFRVDTVKHVEEDVWKSLEEQCQIAFKTWKENNPEAVLDNNDFYFLGELYGYGIGGKRFYDFGDRKVDYFAHGFDNLINFQFKYDATKGYEEIFSYYNDIIQKELGGKTVMNYVSSHDDGAPFDKLREKTFESGTKLLLTPGISQIYYGDETGRSLTIPGTEGDATLRSNMNWKDIATPETSALLEHWRKLGNFRKNHPAIGAGFHKKLSDTPYLFSRTYHKDDFLDQVLVGLDLTPGKKKIPVFGLFKEGEVIHDAYSGQKVKVVGNAIEIDSPFTIVLLEHI